MDATFAQMGKKRVYGKGRSLVFTEEQDARLERLLEAVEPLGVENRNQLFRLVASAMTPDDVKSLLRR